LKAGHEMAVAMGEEAMATEYLDVFKRGAERMADSLWNGDYFIQIVVNDPELYDEDHLSPPDAQGKQIPKYQYGNGCLADQLLGQYLAFVSGLGYIAEPEKIDKALMAIYEHNFIGNLREFENVQRVYGLNDEAGMVLCTWPKGDRPVLPFVYAEEIWTGVEYQVAASLIYSGKVKEGLRVVEAVQNRYNGAKRNPFEHIESGVHYARALSAWSVLLALSGYEYDGVNKKMTFAPKINASDFRSFWSTGSAWGEISINNKEAKIEVIHGTLSLKKLSLQNPKNLSLKTWDYEEEKTINERNILVLPFEE
ncbi:MAG: GH116 family glycosyl hydrolase, partial [Prolixibacteraceae bacterium]